MFCLNCHWLCVHLQSCSTLENTLHLCTLLYPHGNGSTHWNGLNELQVLCLLAEKAMGCIAQRSSCLSWTAWFLCVSSSSSVTLRYTWQLHTQIYSPNGSTIRNTWLALEMNAATGNFKQFYHTKAYNTEFSKQLSHKKQNKSEFFFLSITKCMEIVWTVCLDAFTSSWLSCSQPHTACQMPVLSKIQQQQSCFMKYQYM